MCFYCTQSDILLCGIARFSRGNKNKLKTFSLKNEKIKNSQPQTKFTGSYKKKRVYPISELAQPLCFPADIFRIWCKFDFGTLQGNGELSDKTYKQHVCCLIFLPITTSRLERSVFLKNFKKIFLIYLFLLKKSSQGIFNCFEILIGSA